MTYGENSGKLRAELAVLLRQHRIQQRIGGPGPFGIPESTTVEERAAIGRQVGRYRQAVLVWCAAATRAVDLHGYLDGGRRRAPDQELLFRIETAVARSELGLPTLDELVTDQHFAMVETWRQAARAAALGEHDFGAGVTLGSLSHPQCRAVLKDTAEVTQALVALNRRYAGIPGWHSLDPSGFLGRAAARCASSLGHELDYNVDLVGWRPPPTLLDGAPRPGLAGVMQAGHNLLVHLAIVPDARSLRTVLASQCALSHTASELVAKSDPDAACAWRRRASTYHELVRLARDLGGELGRGGRAAGQGAVAVSRIIDLAPDDFSAHYRGQLDRLFSAIDGRVSDIIEQGVQHRLYFLRVPLPRVDLDAAGLVKSVRKRYTPHQTPVTRELLDLVRTELRSAPICRPPSTDGGTDRAAFHDAIKHRPEGRPGRGLAM